MKSIKISLFQLILFCLFYASDQQTELFNTNKQFADPNKTKTTYNPNKTQTIDEFDAQGKNISRTEVDVQGNTTAFTNFKTKTKTTYNPDKSQTIDVFDNNGKNSSRTEIDARGAKASETIFNSDGTQTKTTYNSDKSQTIDQFGTNHRSTQRKEIDAYGRVTLEIKFYPNKTSLETRFNSDGTKTIIHFNENNQSDEITEIDAHGNPVKSTKFHNDNTQSITTYQADKSQTINQIDAQGHKIATTRIHTNGTKISATEKLIVAWHEAGHAIARIRKDTLSLVTHVTIKADAATKTAGHVISTQIYSINKSVEEIENSILSALCGGIAEQILMQERMLTNSQEILKFFADPRFDHDMTLARKEAQEIVTQKSVQYFNSAQIDQKVDEIIVRLYKNAYEFLVAHKHELQKLAESLMKHETLTTEETYSLLNADIPLMAGQQGPLPASLVNQYKYRGWQTKGN